MNFLLPSAGNGRFWFRWLWVCLLILASPVPTAAGPLSWRTATSPSRLGLLSNLSPRSNLNLSMRTISPKSANPAKLRFKKSPSWWPFFGHRRKGTQLPIPEVRPQYPSLAVWTWEHDDPVRWNTYRSLDGGQTYISDSWVGGSVRQYAPADGTLFMFIVGVDVNGFEITRRSVPIRPDDALQPAPVLVATYPSLATWDWTITNPHHWNAYYSHDDGATFTFDDSVVGSARQYAPAGGQWKMFIVGCNASNVEITERSNVVIPDSAQPTLGPALTIECLNDGVYWSGGTVDAQSGVQIEYFDTGDNQWAVWDVVGYNSDHYEKYAQANVRAIQVNNVNDQVPISPYSATVFLDNLP